MLSEHCQSPFGSIIINNEQQETFSGQVLDKKQFGQKSQKSAEMLNITTVDVTKDDVVT